MNAKIDPILSREEVVFYDTDTGGVVSNIAYLRYVEKARCDLFSALGMPLKEMSESLVFPTVIRTEINYKKPAVLGDILTVEARVESFQKVKIFCEFLIYREEAETKVIISEAKQTVVLVKLPEGKPMRVPDHWKE